MFKHLLFAVSFFLVSNTKAQVSDTSFNKDWKEVDYLILEKKLPKSALAKVDELYKKAKAKKLPVEVIKAILYKKSLKQETTEQDINQQVKYWLQEIKLMEDSKAKAILQLLLAETYTSEYTRNYWQYNNRTNTNDHTPADITTWTKDNFVDAVDSLLQLVFKEKKALQETSLNSFNAIIIKGKQANLRPTLFDLVAFDAIDMLTIFIRRDYADKWQLLDTMALSKASSFIKYRFPNTDSIGPFSTAIKTYQDILNFHQKDKEPSAFIDADIQRVQWMNNNSDLFDKKPHYIRALENIITQHKIEPAADEAWYLLANHHYSLGSLYSVSSNDSSNRFEKVKAMQLVQQRLKQQPKTSYGQSHLLQLKEQIQQKHISSNIEQVNVPNQAFRLLVHYTNTDSLYYRVIKLKQNESFENDDYKSLWKHYTQLPSIWEAAQPLPVTNDYQQHNVEIKIDALPTGKYILLGSSGKNFLDSLDRLFAQVFDISSISHVQNGNDYFVLDRETGQPINNVTVHIRTERSWDNEKKKYVSKNIGSLSTDKNGQVNISKAIGKNDNYYSLTFIKGNDTLSTADSYQRSYDNENLLRYRSIQDFEKKQATAYFFTDRSIYRPGQTVYYKAIVTTTDSATDKGKMYFPKGTIKVYLHDVNNKKIDSAELKQNEYGSMNGNFKLPMSVLTGGFSLRMKDINGMAGFNVEEYKRPTFFVEMDTLKSTYKINDSISVTGTVKAYSGVVLNNAKVNFTVNRNARFIPYWGRSTKRFIPYYGSNVQVYQGTATTDDEGKFTIRFKAKVDGDKIDSSKVYDFAVNVSATDLNGETREGNSSISIGYKSLLLESDMKESNESASFTKIGITTTNLSNQPVNAQVAVKIYSLQIPKNALRKRLWEMPDQFVMNEKEFHQYFPHDVYKDEDDHANWPTKQLEQHGSMNTKTDSFFVLSKPLPQGWYKIEMIAKDSAGNETKQEAFTEILQQELASLPAPAYAWFQPTKTLVQPNDTAIITIGSSEKEVFVIGNISSIKGNEYKGTRTTNSYTFLHLNKNKVQWQQKIGSNDKKGLGLFYAFVKHNRVYTGGSSINVQQEEKNLQITYATYRNKTEPGSKETWSIKIKSNKEEKAAAELLTAMYDASLDQFSQHEWNSPYLHIRYGSSNEWKGNDLFGQKRSSENPRRYFTYEDARRYSQISKTVLPLWWLNPSENGVYATPSMSFQSNIIHDMNPDASYSQIPRGVAGYAYGYTNLSGASEVGDVKHMKIPKVEMVKFTPPKIVKDEDGIGDSTWLVEKNKNPQPKIQPRKNFNETAFFIPNLYADTAGNYTFSFTMPEALTQWKWLSFAHTKDLAFGTKETPITTQKTLMVQPNAPRFMREGDNMEFVAKVSNLSDKELTGQATLELLDATTGNSVDGWFQNSFPVQYFTAGAGKSTVVKFPIQIPFSYNKPLTWRVVAKAGDFSDGEENTLPVLTNRMLVTETLPLYLKPNEQSKSFTFEKLLNNKSESLTHESITVEYTANPIWNVVQSLPYLMEYPYECAEQTFNRLFANAMAASIVAKHPNIKAQFEKWKNDITALKSKLQQNEELKQVLLQETPWVLDAENEQQQQKNIALLFDVANMANGIDGNIEKLKQMQLESGGFPWFKGGYENRYITNYIMTGIGKLIKANALSKEQESKLNPITTKALRYLDTEIENDYKALIKNKADLKKNQLGSTAIEYLYMRSFFDVKVNEGNTSAKNFYYNQAKQFWNKRSSYHAAMIALVLHRNNERRFVNVNILPSLLENTVEDTAKGTLYWKNQHTCFWYESPIEQQSMMINAIHEIAAKEGYQDALKKVDEAKTWLLLNKQTNNWKTTIATADACYALLNTGRNWLSSNQQVQIQLGNQTISNQRATNNEQQETSNGYLKQRIEGSKVKNEMGNVQVTIQPFSNSSISKSSPSYGAIYWQYFEDLDKITPAATPLSINKKLFIERNTDKGKVLETVSDTNQLKVGDKLVVRMVLKTDREMEYLHLKDMRASGTEPINVLSGYKWQEGLGYYEATKDASTNFFIDRMQKGTYVFEYPLYITHTGTFSVGIATIQCMYAPEFTSHSEGLKITVK